MRRHSMRRRTAGLCALAALTALTLALGCTGGDGDSPDVRIEPTAAATATPTAAATPAATATPATSPTLAPAPRPAAGATPAAGDLGGFPFSTGDVRAAVQQAGFTLAPLDSHGVDCSGGSVPGVPYWSANRPGGDSGPVFVLWVYPDPDALRAEWDVAPGSAPHPRIAGCDLPTGFVYWNENLVLTFSTWLRGGAEIAPGDYPQSPGDHPAVGAFLGLSR